MEKGCWIGGRGPMFGSALTAARSSVLRAELDSCRELLQMEPDNKCNHLHTHTRTHTPHHTHTHTHIHTHRVYSHYPTPPQGIGPAEQSRPNSRHVW